MKTILIPVLLCFVAIQLHGQNMKFKTYTTENGLSNNSVNMIVNDSSGVLWVATWDGLNYFDGTNFQVYKHNPQDSTSLLGNFIHGIFIDDLGSLWVQSTLNGMSRHQGNGVFSNYVFKDEIRSAGLDTDQKLVVVTERDSYHFQEGKFEICAGCRVWNPKPLELEKVITRRFPNLQVKDSFRDQEGNIWFATLTTGLFILPNEVEGINRSSFHNYTTDASDPYSLRSNEVYAIHEDLFGNIWLGLKDGGLSMAYKNSKSIYSISAHSKKYRELPGETTRAIHEDQEGSLWLGFYNSGVYVYNKSLEKFEPLSIEPPQPSSDWKRVRSIFRDSQNAVWIGTYAGLIRVDRDKRIHYFPGDSTPHLNSGRNYDIIEDGEENCLWVACWGGVSKYSMAQQRFVPFEGQEKLTSYKVRKIVKRDGKLWLATENHGVALFGNDGELGFLSYENGLLDNSVYSFYVDNATGNYWIATLGGISVYHPERGFVKQITEKEGLFSQLVYGILPGDNHVWASTTKGIASIERNTFKVSVLPPEEGWQSAEFSEGAYYQNERGTIFFAGVKGLNFFHPNSIELNFDLPRIQLKLLENKSLYAKSYPKEIRVKVLPVQFTANPYNKIVFKVEPLEKEWKILDENLLIHYENLPPGSYSLSVKNQVDEAGVHVAQLNVDIPMPLWKSPWFITLTIGSVFSGLFLWRHFRNKFHRLKLQKLIEERTRTIEDQKEKLLEINKALDKKNREISEQKAKLLALHNEQKNPDIEIEKFKKFVLDQFKPPLIHIKNVIDSNGFEDEEKRKLISKQVRGLIRELKDWENLSLLDHLKDSGRSMTILSKLFENLTNELRTQLKTRNVFLVYDYQLSDSWVEIDVLRLKLFFHCVFRELIKFIESSADLLIESWVENQTVFIRTQSKSEVLTENFQQIIDGSPYIKSAMKILGDLKGKMEYEVANSVTLKICIPFMEPEHPHGTMHWQQMDVFECLDPNRFNVIILGKQYETGGLLKLLDHESINFIDLEDPLLVGSLIQQAEIDVLLIYNEKINQQFLDLMEAIKSNHGNKIALPVIYVYELIDYGFQEELIDLGVDTFIQLPSSTEFIFKKLLGLLQSRKLYLEEKKLNSLIQHQDENLHDTHLSPNERLVKQALKVIREQYANPNFRVEMLSQQLGISKIKCYRLFKEVLDTTPSDIIIKLRLQKAEQLLLKKNMNISEVGFECGFNDPKYFSKLFKKHYGASPRSFA